MNEINFNCAFKANKDSVEKDGVDFYINPAMHALSFKLKTAFKDMIKCQEKQTSMYQIILTLRKINLEEE